MFAIKDKNCSVHSNLLLLLLMYCVDVDVEHCSVLIVCMYCTLLACAVLTCSACMPYQFTLVAVV